MRFLETVLRLSAPVLSLLLLAAHFLRSGRLLVVLLLLGAALLLAVPANWARRLLQAVLLLGAVEWLRTLVALMHLRQALHEPYTRLILILGGVTAFTILSAWLLERRRIPDS